MRVAMHKNKLKLTDRMQVIADLVNDGEIVADIGTIYTALAAYKRQVQRCHTCRCKSGTSRQSSCKRCRLPGV